MWWKQIISFDELKTDYKNPIDQCNSLNPVSTFADFSALLPVEFAFECLRVL